MHTLPPSSPVQENFTSSSASLDATCGEATSRRDSEPSRKRPYPLGKAGPSRYISKALRAPGAGGCGAGPRGELLNIQYAKQRALASAVWATTAGALLFLGS